MAKLIRQTDVLPDSIWRCLLRACQRYLVEREQGVEIPGLARSLHHDRDHFHDTRMLETETALTNTSIQYRQATSESREFLRLLDFQDCPFGARISGIYAQHGNRHCLVDGRPVGGLL